MAKKKTDEKTVFLLWAPVNATLLGVEENEEAASERKAKYEASPSANGPVHIVEAPAL